MLSPERWLKVKEILSIALELSFSERRAFIKRECGDENSTPLLNFNFPLVDTKLQMEMPEELLTDRLVLCKLNYLMF